MADLKLLLKTTPKYVSLLAENGIVTVQDFLQYFPRAYEDRSKLKTLNEITQDSMFFQNEKNEKIMVKGQIVKKSVFYRGGKQIYNIRFKDELGNSGYISIFNSGFLASKIKEDNRYIIIGKPNFKYSKITFSHPDVVETAAPEEEKGDSQTHNTGRIFPIYSELQGIKPGWFAQKMWKLMPHVSSYFHEYLPEEFLEKYDLMQVEDTIKEMHYPTDLNTQKEAIKRIFFDKLLRMQLHSLINKNIYQAEYTAIAQEQNWEIIKEIISTLPFELTGAQKKVIKHIIDQIHDTKSMMRLLQGDVGSGKTVVAAISAYYTFKVFDGQSVFLAPLEVLANQHHKTLAKLLLPLGLRVELLTGSLSKGQKDKIKADLLQGKIHVLVGTHAILQKDVDFKSLQFVVIDEQHKFGVRQRAFFKRFASPHILQMSATPIPRSMALAFFGEFDVSIIDELPAGRKPISTKMISENEYIKLKPWILSKVEQGQKVFIVTPLIDESEKMEDLKAATVEYEETKRRLGEKETNKNDDQGKTKLWEKDVFTERIIGIALKVHKALGPKLKENVYKNALIKLLEKEGFKVEQEKKITYKIDGEHVGYGKIDLVVNNKVALELKSLPTINAVDYQQIRAYINQSPEIDRGLLLNFGPGYFDFRRIEKDVDRTMKGDKETKTKKEVSRSPLGHLDPSRIGLLHGRMRPQEKDDIMNDFKSGKLSILVSTTVIEVGVDIPEATIMIIKNADRFGLSQLHQLRGRIGRSDMQSYCFLETKNKSGESAKRLKAMEKSNDGFALAELDLQNRGAGEILGTMQSGESDIPLEILSDLKFIERVREGAQWLLAKYPNLEGLPALRNYVQEKMGDFLA